MSRSAVSSLTNTLEGKGLLRREASTADGRSWILHLTDAGLERIRSVLTAHNDRQSQWAEALTEEKLHTLVEILEEVMAQRSVIGARRRK